MLPRLGRAARTDAARGSPTRRSAISFDSLWENVVNEYSRLLSVSGMSIAALVALSACGGGGGGNNATVAVTPTTVSGVAAKGIVKQARVLVCRIVNGTPEADASCASSTTTNDR